MIRLGVYQKYLYNLLFLLYLRDFNCVRSSNNWKIKVTTSLPGSSANVGICNGFQMIFKILTVLDKIKINKCISGHHSIKYQMDRLLINHLMMFILLNFFFTHHQCRRFLVLLTFDQLINVLFLAHFNPMKNALLAMSVRL